jgi:hypothetical protein
LLVLIRCQLLLCMKELILWLIGWTIMWQLTLFALCRLNCNSDRSIPFSDLIGSDTIIAENPIKQNAEPNDIETRFCATKPIKIGSQGTKESHNNLLLYRAQQVHWKTSISSPCQSLNSHQPLHSGQISRNIIIHGDCVISRLHRTNEFIVNVYTLFCSSAKYVSIYNICCLHLINLTEVYDRQVQKRTFRTYRE